MVEIIECLNSEQIKTKTNLYINFNNLYNYSLKDVLIMR